MFCTFHNLDIDIGSDSDDGARRFALTALWHTRSLAVRSPSLVLRAVTCALQHLAN